MIWHVFRARPQKERDVRNEMFELGASALVPVEFKPTRVSVAGNRRRTHRIAPIAPGYVFAGWPGIIPWAGLHQITGYIGPVALGGTLAVLTQRQIDALQLLSSDAPSNVRPLRSYKPGDRIPIKRGAMAEIMALVTELDDKGAVVEFEMANRRFRQHMPHEALHPA